MPPALKDPVVQLSLLGSVLGLIGGWLLAGIDGLGVALIAMGSVIGIMANILLIARQKNEGG